MEPNRPKPGTEGTIVYAVWLEPFGKLPVSWQKELAETHPDARKKAPVIYVGQTRLTAAERYENHKGGYRSSGVVRRYGKELIVLDEWKPRFPFAVSPKVVNAIYLKAKRGKGDAEAREAAVATLLREVGFYVHSA